MVLSNQDLEHVETCTEDVWERLRGKRIFITGGSGFLGRWLVESLLHANDKLSLGCEICLLTRDSSRFQAETPHIARNPALSCVNGDIKDFKFPTGDFDYLVHAAAETAISGQNVANLIDTEVAGFQRVFRFAVMSGVCRILFVSSGAVYGSKNAGRQMSESTPCTLDSTDIDSRYGELKRFGELYGAACASQYGLEVVLARCFSTYGPYQKLGSHFAMAGFIQDAIARRDILVHGDGLDQRSYMYAADLTVWLLKLLLHGRSCVPYNVGSVVPCSILELAQIVADVASAGLKVRVLGGQMRALAPRVYLPDVQRASTELRLKQSISLQEGVRRTLKWNIGRLGGHR